MMTASTHPTVPAALQAEALSGPEIAVRVRGLHKTFQRKRERVDVLKGVDLDVQQGELLVLLGPSGCGKTTFLRCLVGMENPSSGSVVLNGHTVVDTTQGVFVQPNKRDVGMVFQNYALWPHKRVRQNVEYPLRARGLRNELKAGRAMDMLKVVRCDHLSGRYPPELSGGQQQRVSLARALAANPALLLLDEPLSNLDALLRNDLRAQLRELHHSLGFTAVHVTHDQEEALALASRVAVMSEGEIVQLGEPGAVYRRPATEPIAEFLGARNRFAAEVRDGILHLEGQALRTLPEKVRAGTYSVRARPSELRLREESRDRVSGTGFLRGGTVLEVLPSIEQSRYVIELNQQRLFVDVSRDERIFTPGDRVEVGFSSESVLLYEPGSALITAPDGSSTL